MTAWLIGNRDLIQFGFNMAYIILAMIVWRGAILLIREELRRKRPR